RAGRGEVDEMTRLFGIRTGRRQQQGLRSAFIDLDSIARALRDVERAPIARLRLDAELITGAAVLEPPREDLRDEAARSALDAFEITEIDVLPHSNRRRFTGDEGRLDHAVLARPALQPTRVGVLQARTNL